MTLRVFVVASKLKSGLPRQPTLTFDRLGLTVVILKDIKMKPKEFSTCEDYFMPKLKGNP